MLSWGGSPWSGAVVKMRRADVDVEGCSACVDAELVRSLGRYSKFEIDRELQLPRNTRFVRSIKRGKR